MFLKAKELFLSQGKIKVEVSSPECLNTVAHTVLTGGWKRVPVPFTSVTKSVLMLGDGIEGALRPYLLSTISSCLFIVQMISAELPSSYSSH